ncbi:hypothetical protein [Syntrophorhabdus aromaticivorans]|jgi:hypothetical protein|uniref:Uncharacterized protein n=1 Tax=Syntrophorhabdus aromaticivorans TaxID=328301 RepID=A0A351U094_9BACT|nr:hypothetical protein [Syntrophorhabdus aromaticivorans]NLW36778.1 hypothetical protein [Syntrophorhabdus aromaticivorans]HBA53375.1 hypothetical protein [Syntrophorhabdus aromaticivorans]
MDNIEWIKKHGKKAQGKDEYTLYLETIKKISSAKKVKAGPLTKAERLELIREIAEQRGLLKRKLD